MGCVSIYKKVILSVANIGNILVFIAIFFSKMELLDYKSENYQLEYSGKVADMIPVFKYRSKNTGIQVVVAQVEGPLVNGFFCLGTN